MYLPNFISTETNYEIGMWGQRYLDYIKNNHKTFYLRLKTSCKLNSYLHEVDTRAIEMYERLVKQLKEQQDITEKLKADNQTLWVKKMNNIANRAREIVNYTIINSI